MLTIVTPAASRRLTTPAAVQAALAVQDADAVLLPLIDRASAAIEAWCGRVFAREVVREILLPTRASWHLNLSRWPVSAVLDVQEDGRTVPLADLEIDGGTGILRRLWGGRSASWMACRTSCEYQAGYRLPGEEGRDLPADIEQAAILTVAAMRTGTARDPAVRHVSAGTIDVRFDGAVGVIPPAALALLAPYRVPNLA